MELLRTGRTVVRGQAERGRVTQLQRLLYCGFSMGSPVCNTSFKQRIKEKWTVHNEVFYCTVLLEYYCNVLHCHVL